LRQQVAAGEAAKAKVQTLQQVYDKKVKSLADYTAQRPGLLARWETQRCEVLHLIAQVTERAKWDDVHKTLCDPLTDIDTQKKALGDLQKDLVLLKASADAIYTPLKEATDKVAAATKLSQDWMDVSGALTKRLTDLEARVGAFKRSSTPRTAPPGLYIVFFDLLPDLVAIGPPDELAELTAVTDKLKDCPPLDTKPGPRLVPVDYLSNQQNQAWKDLKTAQAGLQKAQDDIVAATKAVEDAQAKIQTALTTLTTPQPAAAAVRAA
jgi:hypothetical protein